MRRFLFFTLLAIGVQTAMAQYPATSERIYFTQSKIEWVEVTDFTDGIVNDSIFGIIFNSKKYQRFDLNTTSFNAQSLMIRADGTDMSGRINRLFATGKVSEIVIDQMAGGDVMISGDLDLQGGALIFKGYSKIKRLAGSPVIKNGIISGPRNVQIVDTLVTFSNIKTPDGYFYPRWLGAVEDGVADDSRYVQLSINAASTNRLKLKADGQYYINKNVDLKTNIKIIGDGNFIVQSTKTIGFGGAKADSVELEGFSITGVGTANTATPFLSFQTIGDTSYGLVMRNVRLHANRKNYYGVRMTNQHSALVEYCKFFETASTTLLADSCYNLRLQYNDVDDAGRGGFSMYKDTRTFYINGNTFRGTSQHEELDDPDIDVYGPRVRDGKIYGNNVYVGTVQANTSEKRHRALRIMGGIDIDVHDNLFDSESQYLSVMIDVKSRDGVKSQSVRIYHNRIRVRGYVEDVFNWSGIDDIYACNNYIRIDSSATTSGLSANIFQIANIVGDTVNTAILRDNVIDFNGKVMYVANVVAPVKVLDFSGSDYFKMNQTYYSGISTYIGSFKHDGGEIESLLSGQSIFYVQANINAAIINNLTIKKPDNDYYRRSSNNTAAVVNGSNTINGVRAPIEGGGSYLGSYTSGFSAYTVHDTVALFYGSRNSPQTVTLPTTISFKNKEITIVKVPGTTSYIYVTPVTGGNDTVRAGLPIKYHFDGTYWTATSVSGAAGAGSITDGNKGDITVASGVWTANDNAITYSKIQQAAGPSVIGRSANSTGNVAAIIAANAGEILYRNGTTLVFGKPDLVSGISTSLSGYIKAAASSFNASATIPYSDISGVPDLFIKNSSNTGDSIFYMDGDTLKAKRIDVNSASSIVRTRTVGADKILYSFALSGDLASPGANKMYSTDGSGVKGWNDIPAGPGGGLTSVGLNLTATGTDASVSASPLTSNGSLNINLPTASATARGLLSSPNWNTFNNKANGATTLTINGTTYNLTTNRTWNVGTVTSVGLALTSIGTNVSVSGTVSTSGNLTINIPTASASVRGVLSASDWALFFGKAASTTNMVAGNGLIGGGTLGADRTFHIGTPSDITSTSTNSTSADSHTHALNATGVTPGTYTNVTMTVDSKGRVTYASSGASVASTSYGTYVPTLAQEIPAVASVKPWPDSVMIAGYNYPATPAVASLYAENPLASLSKIDTFSYTRIGNQVHLWGSMTIVTVNNSFTSQSIGFTLPPTLPGYFTGLEKVVGTAIITGGSVDQTKRVFAGIISPANYAGFSFDKDDFATETYYITITADYTTAD